jgi:hypothetical protein
MLLSAAQKDSGILPGPYPRAVRINAAQLAAIRARNKWRRHQLGDGYVDISQQSVSLDPSTFFQPTDFTPTIYNPVQTATPYQIQAPDLTTPNLDLGPVSLPTIDASGATYTPTYTQPDYVPPLPDLPAPSLVSTPQAPATPVPQNANPATGSTGGTDYLTAALKAATIAGQTYIAVNNANRFPGLSPVIGAAGLPIPGVTAAGILPGATAIGAGPLTAAQIAALTPAQQIQYRTLYPQSAALLPATNPLTAIFSGTSSTGQILLFGGLGLVAFMLLAGRSKNA